MLAQPRLEWRHTPGVFRHGTKVPAVFSELVLLTLPAHAGFARNSFERMGPCNGPELAS